MKRLPALHQHIIGRINDIVNTLIPFNAPVDFSFPENRLQCFDQPVRTRTNFHTLNDTCRVPWAGVDELVIDFQQVIDTRSCFADDRFRESCFKVEENPDLASDAKVPKAVTTITRHLKINDDLTVNFIGGFMIQTRQTEPLCQLLVVHRKIDVIREPFERNEHDVAKVGGFVRFFHTIYRILASSNTSL